MRQLTSLTAFGIPPFMSTTARGDSRGEGRGGRGGTRGGNRSGHPPGLKGREIGLYYASLSRAGGAVGNGRGGGAKRQAPEERKQAKIVRALRDEFPQQLVLGDDAMKAAWRAVETLSAADALPDAPERSAQKPGKRMRTVPPPSRAGPSREHIHLSGGPLLAQRKRLPVWAHQEEIVATLRDKQVIVISGATGCGKTTQVGQFVLDAFPDANIVCTQPRRISAVGVADRVAAERGEKVGESIGYCIRLEAATSVDTSLLFCTTGILLRRLQSDDLLQDVTHIIVDEIHERSIDADFLLIVLRELLPRRPDLRVILMSATLNENLFADYFGSNTPVLHIPGFTYAVDEYFLEDVIQRTGYALDTRARGDRNGGKSISRGNGRGDQRSNYRSKASRDIKNKSRDINPDPDEDLRILKAGLLNAGRPVSTYSDQTLRTVTDIMDHSDGSVPLPLIEELLEHIDDSMGDGAVLVFLPGWDDIVKLNEALTSHTRFGNRARFRVLPLHSSLPTSSQREIFQRPPPGVRKLVLSTNIAETSVTIDDVVFVIDSGRFKEKTYDPTTNVSCLQAEWISKASSRQRRGRAGRVQEGVCFHLFSSVKFSALKEYQEPEMLRTPLESLCLQVKAMPVPDVAKFLDLALEPPDKRAVANALELLRVIGALHLDTDREQLTALGEHLSRLPVDPRLGKMLIYGVFFQCLDPVLTIASSLGFRNPFTMSLTQKGEADRAKLALAGGRLSDHAAYLGAFEGWRRAGGIRAGGPEFARKNFLNQNSLSQIDQMRVQFLQLLSDAGFVNLRSRSLGTYDQALDQNAESWQLIQGVLVAGLFPSVARVDFGKSRPSLFTRNDGKVKPHPGSVNNLQQSLYRHRWVVYFDKMRSSDLFLLDFSECSPMALALFGGRFSMIESSGRVAIETGDSDLGAAVNLPRHVANKPWVTFADVGNAGRAVFELRREIDIRLRRKLDNPQSFDLHSPAGGGQLIVKTVVQLLEDSDARGYHLIPWSNSSGRASCADDGSDSESGNFDPDGMAVETVAANASGRGGGRPGPDVAVTITRERAGTLEAGTSSDGSYMLGRGVDRRARRGSRGNGRGKREDRRSEGAGRWR
jgi:ATP-dependent RNA helicase DHX36